MVRYFLGSIVNSVINISSGHQLRGTRMAQINNKTSALIGLEQARWEWHVETKIMIAKINIYS